MIPPVGNALTTFRRGEAQRRWTAVLTTAVTGVVLVSLASRLGAAAAVAGALFAATTVTAAVWRAIARRRRWRQTVDTSRALTQRGTLP